MFSYSTAVYGLKQNQRLEESSEIKELLCRRTTIIFEHNNEDASNCGWPGLHYHGLFEFVTALGFNDDKIINAIKKQCCYFTPEDCQDPYDYFVVANKYRMKLVFIEIHQPTFLNKYVNKLLQSQQHENTGSNYSNLQNENIARPFFLNSFTSPNDIQTPILKLCEAINSKGLPTSDYLTPDESTTFVLNWCSAQNINSLAFTRDWINCLDRKLEFKNTLYFQGADNSCITLILNSIMEACKPLTGEVVKGTTGYLYFWKGCVDRRMVALVEPYFDGLNSSNKLLEILEGTDTCVKISNNGFAYIRRTPVVVIAQEWENKRKLQFNIENRLVKCYKNLKGFCPPKGKLHPEWLSSLAKRYHSYLNLPDEGSKAVASALSTLEKVTPVVHNTETDSSISSDFEIENMQVTTEHNTVGHYGQETRGLRKECISTGHHEQGGKHSVTGFHEQDARGEVSQHTKTNYSVSSVLGREDGEAIPCCSNIELREKDAKDSVCSMIEHDIEMNSPVLLCFRVAKEQILKENTKKKDFAVSSDSAKRNGASGSFEMLMESADEENASVKNESGNSELEYGERTPQLLKSRYWEQLTQGAKRTSKKRHTNITKGKVYKMWEKTCYNPIMVKKCLF